MNLANQNLKDNLYMDNIVIKSSDSVKISLSQQSTQINIGRPQKIGMEVSSNPVTIKPQKTSSVAFEFVQKVVAGANVVRCTLEQFQSFDHLDGKTWYAVTTTSDELRYLYLGPTLIAQASQDGGTWGFAYTFPMTFGR